MRKNGATGLVCLALGACAAAPERMEVPIEGSVGRVILDPAQDEARLQMSERQRFLYPLLTPDAEAPAYPPDLLALRLAPVSVCVHVDIGADGLVTAVGERVDAGCGAEASPHRARFVAVALNAVSGWVYEAAVVCTAPEDDAGDDPCAAEGRVETPTAVRLGYAFTFSQRDGVPTVERSR